jgi:hypothetical protein
LCFAIGIGLTVVFALSGPIKRESRAADNLSCLAAALQIFSQLIPFYSAVCSKLINNLFKLVLLPI